VRHNCNTVKKFLTSLFSSATVQSPSTNRYSKVKIILDEQDIKAILTDYVRHNFSPLMELDELETYTYAPTATFVLETEDDSAQ
jgi:hypothetical protein